MREVDEKALRVFFAGMRGGYAFGNEGQPCTTTKLNSLLIDWKEIRVKHQGWLLVDRWGPSSGQTVIYNEEALMIWAMYYGGEYNKKAIPPLKAALAHSYEKKEFCAGRGPRIFKYSIDNDPGQYQYRNDWYGNFLDFHTREEITCIESPKGEDITGTRPVMLGYHECRGGMYV